MSDKEDKMKKMKNDVQEFNAYWPCLLSHASEIEQAAMDSNFAKIQEIFVQCNVPRRHWKKLMKEIQECPDMQPWG